jgi:hypothetical protein
MAGGKASFHKHHEALTRSQLKRLNLKVGHPIYVRYKDHTLFRNTEANHYKPVVRETVGWPIKQNEDAIWILWDRSVQKLPHERIRLEESGLVVLKSEILELRRLE